MPAKEQTRRTFGRKGHLEGNFGSGPVVEASVLQGFCLANECPGGLERNKSLFSTLQTGTGISPARPGWGQEQKAGTLRLPTGSRAEQGGRSCPGAEVPEAASLLRSSAGPVVRSVLGSQGSPAALEHEERPREAAALCFGTISPSSSSEFFFGLFLRVINP